MPSDDLRERFNRLSRTHFEDRLLGRYAIRMVGADEWERVFPPLRDEVLPGDAAVDLGTAVSPEEQERVADLGRLIETDPLVHRVLFLDGGAVAGAFWGRQKNHGRYYMMYTVIREAHRGHGLYSAFLGRLLPLLREIGFLTVYSRHRADNNAVLVPKLKAGFTVYGLEVSPRFGLMLLLHYLCTPAMRDLHGYRVDAAPHAASLRARGILRESPGP